MVDALVSGIRSVALLLRDGGLATNMFAKTKRILVSAIFDT
jgi:hypothetical protein